ncbi:tetratricopeptide repeat-containing glycosyltransferase family protein [Acetobacter sp.]|jgi:hypothetical protein|uniref:tetratricopeptide repeat-containing glycosyltransferase family protein n=1 Tax=Acetobacter sp. TaxID=440 RepID=UPI0025C22F00|nr:tetratricopeptide repeat-containing glycosyltransferase family protein [Acetobacter sp.]MCH4090196.1 tetratricopeptide repeat-containing glycosyltransferase family protein [Acetobacter sp.]MCI1298890.1 tetratricopeptide repeat-containing glycosyltransferase family protein [Acetobacter sp.]MCI1314910.1 tetratricopeptide repeat-containing glycosyltransferase family protein [Acetobacter sp.]
MTPSPAPHSDNTAFFSDAGTQLQREGRILEAEAVYRKRIGEEPRDALTLSNYGGLLVGICRFEPALEVLKRAVALAPNLADAWSNLGNALQSLQRYDEAIAAYSKCLSISLDHPLAASNLGVALDSHRGQHETAQKFHRVAVELAPDNPETHTNYALSLLAQGNYPQGFAEYEWRWKIRTTRQHGFDAPLWQGERFDGRTLLIHTEGGFGDVLQFSRFIPLVAERGGTTIVRIRPELLSLLSRSFPQARFVSEKDPAPIHDIQCPVLSLPLALDMTLDTLPSPEGFLKPDPEKVQTWAERIRRDTSSSRLPRIGLVWAGAPHSEIREAEVADRRRSTTLSTLAPLAAHASDAIFFSLQVGEQSCQARTPPAGMKLIDYTDALNDFGETAALIANLDLVIAVDTSTAHVAAGIGKPVWLLSRYDQCWRWLSNRTDSPWYTSVRIYQQDTPLDWSGPVARIAMDLKTFERQHQSGKTPEPTSA